MDSKSHQRLDQRSLAFHRLISERVRKQPRLLDIARDNVARWQKRPAAGSTYLVEWERILASGMENSLSAATEESENGDRLRQSSPFAGLISPRERWEFLRLWNEHNSSI